MRWEYRRENVTLALRSSDAWDFDPLHQPLKDGWEPFAVTTCANEDEIVHLRRESRSL